MSSKIRTLGMTTTNVFKELTKENEELKQANDMLCIMINALVRKADGHVIVLTPFEINAVLNDGIRDLKTSVDPTNSNLKIELKDEPGRKQPLSASSLTQVKR